VARSPAGAPDRGGVDAAVRAVALRLAADREELANRVVERIQAEEDDATAREDQLSNQVWLELIDDLVAGLRGAALLAPPRAERLREIAARRVLQRVSLESFLRRPRIWGQVVWEAVVAGTLTSDPLEGEAALRISSKIMELVDLTSRVITNAYLDEITDRGLLRRDLLDALISGKGDGEDARRLARSLHLTLADSYLVVALRGDEIHGELGTEEPLPSRVTLDRIVEAARRRVQPAAGSLLAGMRQGDLLVLVPVSGPEDLQRLRNEASDLAKALAVEVSLGVSSYYPGLAGVATAYAEARDAVEVADRLGVRGRAVGLDDVLVDHMLSASPHAQRLLMNAMEALVDYDRQHGSELVTTLQAYVATRFNFTKSGEALFVHPNTVAYRLRRIHELTGRDPYEVDDMLVLWIGLKTLELRGRLDVRERQARRSAA
jgi:sugar diacid utilization regulator